MSVGLVVMVTAVGACAARRPAAPSDEPPIAAASILPGLNVQLVWDAPVDLDLYLTDPSWETVYFGNNPSRSGARLVRDVRCADARRPPAGGFVELAHAATPAPGPYRIGVDFIDACEAEIQSVRFRVVARLGTQVIDIVATIRPAQFLPLTLELEIDRDGRMKPFDVNAGLLSRHLARGRSLTDPRSQMTTQAAPLGADRSWKHRREFPVHRAVTAIVPTAASARSAGPGSGAPVLPAERRPSPA